MATATTPPTPSTSLRGSAAAPGYDQFVDSRIAKTRTAVKSADVATGVVALIAWALVVLLVAAVADHWIVSGGLDRWERYALWGVGLAGAGLYVATRLGPNLWRSVNPLYAARELERETPELKNSLLNLLQLRGATDSPAIKQALERQAAERLARAGDAPIDHTPLVRAAKLLLALVALVGVYVVASPKDFFASAGRVLAPWSQIAAPSRVRITAVEPGAVTLAQGARLNVTAMVSGLKADELVELVYTSDDRQAVGRRVPMTASRGGVQFSGSLPAGSGAASALGLQGSLTYRIEAGDAHTPYYQVEVLTAPTIAPVTVRYEYPPYTGYKTREVEGVGDLRAIEGTRVTLSVEANLPIESAQVDIGADGRPDVRMTADSAKATGAFVLRHDGDGATSTSNYVLRFTSTDGQANNDPPQYQIEVLRDLPPEAAIREPEAESIDVGLNQRVRVAIEARDPDYALKRVRLLGEAGGKQVLEQDLLRGDGKGGFKAESEIVPQAIGLRPGDVLDYWVEATDNRTPQPNVSVSQRHQLRVMAPGDQQQGNPRDGDSQEGEQQPGEGGDPRQDQQGDPDAEGENGEQQQDGGAAGQPNQGQPNQDQPGDQEQPGESGENGQQGGQSKSQANEDEGQQGENGQPPPGGMTGPGNDGGANSENESGEGNEGSASSKPNDGENTPAGGSQAGEPNQGQQGDQQQPGDNQSGQNGGDQSAGGKPSPNNQQQGQQPGEQPQGGEPVAGEQSDGEGAGENPVARDGSDDGSAFDKMLDWMKQQQGDKPSGKPSPSNQQNQDGGENGEAGQDAQQSDGEQSQDDSQAKDGQGRGDELQQDQSKKQQDQSKDQQGQSSDQQGKSGDQQGQPGEESDASASEDEGGASEADEKQDVAGESNGRQGERGKEGQGGANGKQQPRNQPGGKQPDRNEQGPGAGEQDRSGEQSNSKSSESGGDKPPGESTDRDAGPREGADGAGQSQAADRGAGQSADKGAGDASGREGGEQASDSPTGGESGDERGEGSKSRESATGEERAREERSKRVLEEEGTDDASNKQQGGQQPSGQQPGEQSGQSPEGSEGESGQQPGDDSQPSGDAQQNPDQQNSLNDKRGEGARDSRSPVGDGGGPMELADRGATSDAAGDGAESGGDAANLDYAREQTDLVLQRLDDQLREKEVDRKLLDKLGWTEEDLQDFVNRWKSRQQKATERGAEGEAELDRALKSLGLNPEGPTAKSNVTDDSFRDLRENARAKTPPRMREQVESYLRSINAADDAPTSNE
jgi:hypothetical protein